MTFFRGQLRLFPGVYTLWTKNKTKLSTFEMQESKILSKSGFQMTAKIVQLNQAISAWSD